MGYVYIIEDEKGRVKIGRSINPKRRIHTISTSIGMKINKAFVSEDYNNYSNIENLLLKNFRNDSSIGEWVDSGFSAVVEYAEILINDIGLPNAGVEGSAILEGDELNQVFMEMAYADRKRFVDEATTKERAQFLMTMNQALASIACNNMDWEEAFMDVFKMINEMARSNGDDSLNKAMKHIIDFEDGNAREDDNVFTRFIALKENQERLA